MRLSVLLFVLLNLSLSAQQYTFTGKVLDQDSQEPVSGVNIVLDGKPVAATGASGQFSVEVEKGRYLLNLRFIAYETLTDTITITEDVRKEYHLQERRQMLDQVVISAGKQESRLKEVTVSLDLLEAGEIASQQTITLDDALERASGISIIDGQINIRGGSGFSYGAGSRVMLLLNGMPILRGDAGFPPWNYLPVENIEQVEVIKGASSVLYGSAALNGIINLRTAWPDDSARTTAEFYSGIYDKPANNSLMQYDSTFDNGVFTGIDTITSERAWWEGDIPFYSGAKFSHRQQFGRLDVVMGGHAFLEESYLQSTYTRRARGNVSLRHRAPGDKWIYGIHTSFMRNRNASFFLWEDDSSGIYKPYMDNITHSNSTLFNADPFIHYYGDKGWKHTLQGRYFLSDLFTNDGKGTLNDIYYAEYELQKDFKPIQLKMNGGLVANYTKVEAELYGDTLHRASNYAGFFQLEKRFGPKLRAIGGIRYEYNTINDEEPENRWVGRLGINYQPLEHTFLRASFGQGYRFPTIAEKYVNTNVGAIFIFPNEELASEHGWSAEVGAKQGYRLGNIEGFVDAAAFYNTYRNMMEFVFGVHGTFPGFRSENVGDTEIRGLEIMMVGQGKAGNGMLQFSTGYTYIQPKYLDFDSVKMQSSSVDYNILKYRSKHTFKASTMYECGKWNAGLHGRYYSHVEAVDNVFEGFPGVRSFRQHNQEGNWIFDISAEYEITGRISAGLRMSNLFSNTYSLRPGLMEAPRSIALSLRTEL